ncbi:methyltransferase [Candidatus Bathyarchaeota archaeon]|nr:methyltransferase [Candidatus Bathyarchaeota archaeon]
MRSASKKVFFADYVFYISKNVYEPAEDSFLFAENLTVKEGDTILDVGTGCGILGIIAAEKASNVFAIDVNPYAVRCAKKNAKLNNVSDKMFIVQCDLFAAMRTGQKFNSIFFNAPYLPSGDLKNANWLERAWLGGVEGRQIIDRFICGSPKYLEENGCVFLMQSTLSGFSETLRKFEENDLKASIVARCDLPFFEAIALFKARQQIT